MYFLPLLNFLLAYIEFRHTVPHDYQPSNAFLHFSQLLATQPQLDICICLKLWRILVICLPHVLLQTHIMPFLDCFFLYLGLCIPFFLSICRFYVNFNRGLDVDIIYEPTFFCAFTYVCVWWIFTLQSCRHCYA